MLQMAQNKLLGCNLYAYCLNNPVNDSDPTGNMSLRLQLAILAGLAYGIYNTGSFYGMTLDSAKAWAKLGLAFAKGFIKGFSAVYTFGKNKTTLAAFVIGIGSVIFGLIDGSIKSPKKALKVFINAYTDVTSVSVGQRLFSKLHSKHRKFSDMLNWIWEAFFN